MADDPNRIDPRYDPAFQRGFSGEIRTTRRGESALRRTAVVSSAPDRLPAAPVPSAGAAASQPPVEAVPAEPAAAEPAAPEPIGPREPAAVPSPVVVAAESASARDVTRNPFYLAAAALAVLLIVGGAVWLNQGFAAIADDRTATNVGYYAAMAMSFGAPLLIGIGIAIIAGLLFVLARGWRARDDERD
jgi:hypothetical protein